MDPRTLKDKAVKTYLYKHLGIKNSTAKFYVGNLQIKKESLEIILSCSLIVQSPKNAVVQKVLYSGNNASIEWWYEDGKTKTESFRGINAKVSLGGRDTARNITITKVEFLPPTPSN